MVFVWLGGRMVSIGDLVLAVRARLDGPGDLLRGIHEQRRGQKDECQMSINLELGLFCGVVM